MIQIGKYFKVLGKVPFFLKSLNLWSFASVWVVYLGLVKGFVKITNTSLGIKNQLYFSLFYFQKLQLGLIFLSSGVCSLLFSILDGFWVVESFLGQLQQNL
jgi:hypothetical protein